MNSHTNPALSPVHLVGRFDEPYSGACLELMALRDLLAVWRPVECWSVVPPHAAHAARGVKVVQPFAGHFPRRGLLYWGGAHVAPEVWLKYTQFERVVVHVNLASYARLFALINILRETTSHEPELVFVSESLRLTAGLPGRVLYSVMDIVPLMAVAADRRHDTGWGKPVTVGRVSRDVPDKHHPLDPLLYRMLAAAGQRVRVMGGTCLAAQLEGVEGIELLPAGAEPVDVFYGSLDIFFYRTGSTVEAYGRVVAEAMASGLPVVVENRGGYVEVVEAGTTGLLVKSQEEAWDALQTLVASPSLRRQMGVAAASGICRFHGPEATANALAFCHQ